MSSQVEVRYLGGLHDLQIAEQSVGGQLRERDERDVYNGVDPEDGSTIEISKGESAMVSSKKAQQLEDDHGDAFEVKWPRSGRPKKGAGDDDGDDDVPANAA